MLIDWLIDAASTDWSRRYVRSRSWLLLALALFAPGLLTAALLWYGTHKGHELQNLLRDLIAPAATATPSIQPSPPRPTSSRR
jgi:hypothetical protein